MSSRTVSVNLVANIGQYVSGMNAAAGATMRLGESATTNSKKAQSGFDLAGKGALIMGAAVVGGMGMAISKSMEFEKAMSAAAAGTQAAGSALGDLRDAAMRAGADTQYSATEAAQAITEMGKAGVATADILNGGLNGALSLAAAGQLDVAKAAEIASVAMTQYSLSGDKLPHVADLLAAGAGKAMGSVEDLGMALNQAGLVASATGLSIEETTGTLAAFASAGLIGSDAGTSLKTMLQRLQAPSEEAAGVMAELGVNMYDAGGQFVGMTALAGQLQAGMEDLTPAQRDAAMATIFGSDAVRAANVLFKEGAQGIADWTAKVDDQGYAAEQAAKLTDNLAGDLERLGGSFETLMITLGEGAQGPLRMLVQGLGGVVDGITWMVEAWDSVPGPVQAGVAALAAVHLLGGPMQTAFKGVGFAIDVMTASLKNAGGPMSLMRSGAGGLLGVLGGPWGLAITGATVALTGLWSWLNNTGEATDEAKSAAEQYADALERSNGAIDENVRLSAAKAAEDAGVLATAADAGIQLDSVTDAITGQSDALESVRDKLKAYIAANNEMVMTENGPVYHLNAEGEAAQKALTALELLAGQTGATEESQGRIAAAAGTTGAALETQKAQTEAAMKAQSELGESLADFVNPLGAYTGLLGEKKEADRLAAEATAAGTESSKDSWRDYVTDVGVTFDEYMARLEEQVTAQTNWQTNMLMLAGRVSQGTLDELSRMGPEGAPLVADLVTRSDAELDKFDDITASRSKEATDAWGKQLTDAAPVLAAIGKIAGQGVVDELAAKLAAGTTTVAKIASDYGIQLADGINPVLSALGRSPVTIAKTNAKNEFAEGGYTGPGGKYQPAGIVHAGEVVWSQEDVAAHGGPQKVDAMRKFRGYAEGGIVALGHRLQAMGGLVAEHPAFPPLSMTGHGKTSLHYTGHAIDVNTRPGTSALEQRELAPMAALARSLGFRTIFMAPDHFNHLHVDDGGSGSIGSTGVMASVTLPKPPSTAPFAAPISTGADAAMQHMYEQATAWVAENTIPPEPEPTGGGPVGSGVERWRGLVVDALGKVGQAPTLADTTLRRMNKESGGNPRAINNWDSNAAKGTPSKGLMQVIDPTFRAYAMAGYNRDIWDPMSNVLASMRYALARYGSLPAAYNRAGGYANGGTTPADRPFWVGENGPELMWSSRQQYVTSAAQSREFSGSARGSATPVVNVSMEGATITGTLDFDPSGVVRLVDGRIVAALTGATDRGRQNG